MYTRYVFKPNSSLVNILSDLNKLISATTNLSVSSLSSDCDKDASLIIASLASEWSQVNIAKIFGTTFTSNLSTINNLVATSKFFLASSSNSINVEVSSCGSDWKVNSPGVGNILDINSNSTNFFVIGDYNLLATSDDGIKWVEITSRLPGALTATSKIIRLGEFIAIKVNSSSQDYYFSNDNGLTFSAKFFPVDITASKNTAVNSSGLIVLTSSTNTNIYYTSTNGYNWTSRTFPSSILVSSICCSGSEFTITDGSATLISSDGINWFSGTSIPISGTLTTLYHNSFGTLVVNELGEFCQRMPGSSSPYTRVYVGYTSAMANAILSSNSDAIMIRNKTTTNGLYYNKNITLNISTEIGQPDKYIMLGFGSTNNLTIKKITSYTTTQTSNTFYDEVILPNLLLTEGGRINLFTTKSYILLQVEINGSSNQEKDFSSLYGAIVSITDSVDNYNSKSFNLLSNDLLVGWSDTPIKTPMYTNNRKDKRGWYTFKKCRYVDNQTYCYLSGDIIKTSAIKKGTNFLYNEKMYYSTGQLAIPAL